MLNQHLSRTLQAVSNFYKGPFFSAWNYAADTASEYWDAALLATAAGCLSYYYPHPGIGFYFYAPLLTAAGGTIFDDARGHLGGVMLRYGRNVAVTGSVGVFFNGLELLPKEISLPDLQLLLSPPVFLLMLGGRLDFERRKITRIPLDEILKD